MTAFDLSIDLPTAARPLRAAPWGTVASVAFHGALAAALVLLSPLGVLTSPPEQVVTVDVVSRSEFEALQRPAPAATTDANREQGLAAIADERLAPAEPLVPDIPEQQTVTAADFYSANILREPGMERIRQRLTTFADRERIIQICNIEAVEQIARGAPEYDPDTVVGYAMADLVISGLGLTAAGGAFRSRRRWYEISYHCTAAPGYEGVTAFDFTLGGEIPESAWEAHNLNVADDDDED